MIQPNAVFRSARRALVPLAVALALSVSAVGVMAQAADKNAERAARRAQLQAQNLQQQIQEAQAAKAKVDTEKAAVDKQLLDQSKQLAQIRGALPRANANLKAVEAERTQLAATVAALEKQLVEQKRSAEEALALKARELVQYTRLRDEQQALWQRRHGEELTQVAECTDKNERLIRLSAELLGRYRNKTATDVLKQREPAFGLGDVQMFNLVQDYRDKAEAERFSPSINR